MISKAVLIHYNGEGVHKEGNDNYKGMIHLAVVPDKYTLEDLKKRAMNVSGFLHEPCFDVYGLINVPGTAFKQRLKIGSEDMLNFHVGRACGVPSFFTIKNGEEVKVDIPPLTPKSTIGDDSKSKMLLHTPLTPLNNLESSSSEDYRSKNETSKGDGGVKASTSGLKARRCLELVMTPSAQKLRCLHDAPTTPAPVLDIPKPPKDMKYNDLCVGNVFKIKATLKLILAIAKVERNFEFIHYKTDKRRFIDRCKDKTCKWRMRAVPVNSCGWWKLTVANDVHTCESNKRTDPELRTKAAATGIAELFKHKFKELDAAFTPNQLVTDIKRDYGVVINYRQGYDACKRGNEWIKGSPDELYQYLVGYSHMLGARNKHYTIFCVS